MKARHRIGIDCRMIRHTGIGTYLRGLLASMNRRGILRKKDIALFGPRELEERFPDAQHYLFEAPIYSPREQVQYPLHLQRCRLWHAPHYNVPFLRSGAVVVATVHDLIHWIFRREYFSPAQAFYARVMLTRAVSSSGQVICVSENTRQDLILDFRAKPEKLTVIAEAVDPEFGPPDTRAAVDAVLEKHRLREPYFLFVGSLKPHKNVLWLLRVFRRLRVEKKIRTRLVLAGRKDRRYDETHQELASLISDPDVTWLDRVEDGDLASLYAGALALVHPSRYEGFGLTLLEAMACGTPVLAVRTSSIPEVTGDAAFLLPDFKDEALAEALVRLEQDTDLREDLRLKGRARVMDFSWDKAADVTLEVYEKGLAGS